MADLPAGSLSLLPRELRDVILGHLLTAPPDASYTFGWRSNISTAILRTCRLLHVEGSVILYNRPHVLYYTREHSVTGNIMGVTPPPWALNRLKHLTLSLNFSTHNRGECETGIVQALKWADKCHSIGLGLLRSQELLTLRIQLWNRRQRKIGPKRIRSPGMRDDVRDMLKVFAYLRDGVDIRIEGFDVLEWIELFDEMRKRCIGKEAPLDDWMKDAMVSQPRFVVHKP